MINYDRQSRQWLVSASQHSLIANRHSLTHSLTRKTTKLTIKTSIISIKLTVYTEDKAVGMAADDTTSVEEATIAMATIAVVTVAIATIAAIIITVAQTREAYKKAIVEKAKKDTKAFNKRNATSITNLDTSLTSMP
jgi:hypothetical protein